MSDGKRKQATLIDMLSMNQRPESLYSLNSDHVRCGGGSNGPPKAFAKRVATPSIAPYAIIGAVMRQMMNVAILFIS